MKIQRKIQSVACVIAIVILCASKISFAQDPHFSQYYASPLLLNPALAGSKSEMKAVMNYRSQWSTLRAFSTTQLSLIYPVLIENQKRRLGGVGISILGDRAGEQKYMSATHVTTAYSYNQPIGDDNAVNFAVSASFIQKSLNVDKLIFGDQYNPGSTTPNPATNEDLSTIKSKVSYADFGGGLLWTYSPDAKLSGVNAFFGGSVLHFLEPNESFMGGKSKLPMRINVHGGMKIFGLKNFDFAPNFLVMLQGGSTEINAGGYAIYNFSRDRRANNFLQNGGIVLGGWYRNKDAAIILIGIEHLNFSFGFSYDINISKLKEATSGNGATEISLAFRKALGRRPNQNNPSPGF